MTSKKAIEILNKQIEKLSQNRNENWTIETHTYIKMFFGENSRQNDFFRYYSWSDNPGTNLNGQEKATIDFLKNCINTIKNVGLHKEPKHNFLNQLSDSLIVLILSVIGFVCFGLGKYMSDVQNIELKSQVERLTKSPISTPNSNSNKTPKHTDKAKN
jgi:hypothetical protein